MPDQPKGNQTTDHDALIDENLERVFDALLQEDLPERFLQVIRMLEAQDRTDNDDEGNL